MDESEFSEDANGIIEGLREVAAIQRGEADPKTYRVHHAPDVDTKVIRKRLGLTQKAFAECFGLSVDTVRDWEYGRRLPDRAAKQYLRVISHDPEAVLRALAA